MKPVTILAFAVLVFGALTYRQHRGGGPRDMDERGSLRDAVGDTEQPFGSNFSDYADVFKGRQDSGRAADPVAGAQVAPVPDDKGAAGPAQLRFHSEIYRVIVALHETEIPAWAIRRAQIVRPYADKLALLRSDPSLLPETTAIITKLRNLNISLGLSELEYFGAPFPPKATMASVLGSMQDIIQDKEEDSRSRLERLLDKRIREVEAAVEREQDEGKTGKTNWSKWTW